MDKRLRLALKNIILTVKLPLFLSSWQKRLFIKTENQAQYFFGTYL